MFDVIVIGAGPAGISSAIYAKRANLNVLVLYSGISNLERATKIDNFYGFQNGISGKELFERGILQAKNLGIEVKREEVLNISQILSEYNEDNTENDFINAEENSKGSEAKSIESSKNANDELIESFESEKANIENLKENNEKEQSIFNVKTEGGEYKSKSVIIATGNKKVEPNIKGIKEFEGKGISYCAICDAFFYKNKEVAVIGSGKFALSEAEILKNVASKVYIISNDEALNSYNNYKNNETDNNNPSIEKENKDISNNVNLNFDETSVNVEKISKKLEIINKRIKEITGENKVENIVFEDESSLKIDGIFIAMGEAGASDFARTLGILTDKNNNIVVNENMMTNISGIFACGNILGGLLQVNKAVYEGAKSGIEVSKYLNSSNNTLL